MSESAPMVTVLLSGHIERDGNVIRDASSSVVLVRSADRAFVVDTGAGKDRSKISSALRELGLTPQDVDSVINTHLHVDHCGCNDMFENARFYAHSLEDPPIGTTRISGRMHVMPSVEIVPTPGHTPGSVTVFVHGNKRFAICGDAIPTKANYDTGAPPFIAFDKPLARKSMEMVLSWAEIVIPGHDRPFEIIRKK